MELIPQPIQDALAMKEGSQPGPIFEQGRYESKSKVGAAVPEGESSSDSSRKMAKPRAVKVDQNTFLPLTSGIQVHALVPRIIQELPTELREAIRSWSTTGVSGPAAKAASSSTSLPSTHSSAGDVGGPTATLPSPCKMILRPKRNRTK